tara:strand:+ start:315 stop:569 length:255 start_codon:yes stop_codon:yes gene_type:complete
VVEVVGDHQDLDLAFNMEYLEDQVVVALVDQELVELEMSFLSVLHKEIMVETDVIVMQHLVVEVELEQLVETLDLEDLVLVVKE